jgi:hypothetical protein
MKITLKIVAFFLLLSIAVEKIVVVFIAQQDASEMVKADNSKKAGPEEDADNDKKEGDGDKYLYLNTHQHTYQLFLKNCFGVRDTRILLHPYRENDPKPPRVA